ncbi:MAG: tRNA uridine-5-carboxymethylaminomethyl(34) synthesis enzyme MnmG, partial [Balneolales bacterium]|nr:tRNA uridine-5-carboxymethylaminomethyl(34) synthesis enzyme MnmG [Balneolales bacterium]
VMIRPGYAIEYDFFPPHQIYRSMETKIVSNLFFAGQINGTTGYEEAACQGLMAGINAALKVKGKEPFILKRSEAYIGVLIDDLVGKGTDEPYRMFTSRAEHRIVLRQDNADLRLTEIGSEIGLVTEDRLNRFLAKKNEIEKLQEVASDYTIRPETINSYLESANTSPLKQPVKLSTVITRPQVSLRALIENDDELLSKVSQITTNADVVDQIEIQLKYAGYIEKEYEMVEEVNRQENLRIPDKINYNAIKSLSNEGVAKLSKVKPETIGQASRISGVSPSDISILMVYLKN